MYIYMHVEKQQKSIFVQYMYTHSMYITQIFNDRLLSKPKGMHSSQILWTKLNTFHVREVLNPSFMKAGLE